MRLTSVVRSSSLCPAWLAVAALAALAATGAAPARGADDLQQRGTELVARAAALENLLAPDTGRFRLRVRVKLFGLVAGLREGEVLLLVTSPARWYQQVRFPGYTELEGLADGTRWRKRNVIDKPFRFHEVTQLLDVWSHLKMPPGTEVRRVTQGTVAGRPALCVESEPTAALWQQDVAGRAAIPDVKPSRDSRAELCFAADTGALLSAAYGKELPRFEYDGEVALGAKRFPTTMRCFEGKALAVEATVEELVADSGGPTEAAFAPPAGAVSWPECGSPTPPRLIVKRDPGVDAYAKAHRIFGTVVALGEVGTDGLLHDLAFIQLRGGLYGGVREAAKQWKYAPATCDGVPVPSQIYIAYTFLP